ncbi:helix-turn-helix domain-containing protein [Chitinophaga alhagiae]|uniref:helix-turn-helix domain-containing protein n=1 Tax=Chitinophaga alhagiae TaxID=2203219 RepID=UPI000E5AB9FB|nr:AraC family transcriptional regulator [Chitinophaga alhagiae]
MKSLIQKLPLSEQSSFVADRYVTPYFETPWHYHPEYELVLIIRGKGKRFVGDHVSDYCEGELDLLGPNLPHWYRKDDEEEQGGSLVVHFREAFLGKDFLQIPEMQPVLLLFERAATGLHFTGNTRASVSAKMEAMLAHTGMERLMCLLSVLQELSASAEYAVLSSPGVTGSSKANDRLQQIFDYVLANFRQDIQLEEIARMAMMSPSSFSRYFRQVTKKTFSHFVNQIRVGHACRQLMKTHFSISYICQDSGFNNMTNFSKQFRKIVRLSPSAFRRKHRV